MTQPYYSLVTPAGLAYEAACKAAGKPVVLVALAVGDGNGAAYAPTGTETGLKREVWRGQLSQLARVENHPDQVLASALIPATAGGWTLRELALWTDTGVLYAIGNLPASDKPSPDSGSAKEFELRIYLQTAAAAQVSLIVDASVITATQTWTRQQITTGIAEHSAAADPHPQYLTAERGKAQLLGNRAKRLFHSSGT